MTNPQRFDWSVFFIGVVGRCFRSLGPSCCPSPLLSQPFRKSSCEMRREGDQLLALPGPWPCSCGGILLVPPVGPGAGWPEQQENVSQVRGCLAHQDGLSAREWTMTSAQTTAGDLICGWVSCDCCLLMGDSPLCGDLHCHHPVFLSHLLGSYCYRLSMLLVVQCHPDTAFAMHYLSP